MNDIIEYQCPACGGALMFDIITQKLKCTYCDGEFDVDNMQKKDSRLGEDGGEETPWVNTAGEWSEQEQSGMFVFRCRSCGGQIIANDTEATASCPFCNSTIVMAGRLSGALKPDYIIPFRFDKAAAKERYYSHLKGKLLLPGKFRSRSHIDEIKGVYVPFWLYSSDVQVDAVLKASKVRTWSDEIFDYTETSTFYLNRRAHMSFEHIPCDGSVRINDELMESIEPFDFREAVPFKTAYLAGFLADKYDRDDVHCAGRAASRIFESAVEQIMHTVDPAYEDVKRPEGSSANGTIPFADIRIESGSVKYALLPVWLLNTTYKGVRYTFAMNGQTGKFVGDLPADGVRSGFLFAGVFAGVSALATFLINAILT